MINLKLSSEKVEYITFVAFIANLTLMAIYIHGVYLFNYQVLPEPLFWLFTIASSLSVIILWFYGRPKVVLMAILVASFVIVSFPALRFFLYGADLVEEYFVASYTCEVGRWQPELVIDRPIQAFLLYGSETILHRYFSTTSVTILPTIISHITGIPMRLVFWMLISVVSTFTVLIGYLIIRMGFGNRIAGLSSIIFIFTTFYINKFSMILKEDVALLFLFIMVLTIYKIDRKYLLITLISVMALTISHYGLIYFAFFFMIILLILKYQFKNTMIRFLEVMNPNININIGSYTSPSYMLFILIIVIGLSWLSFIAYPIFANVIAVTIDAFYSIILGYGRQSYFQQHIVFSSLGIFHTVIQWLERASAIIGLFICIKIWKRKETFTIIVLGGSILASGLILAILPTLSSLFDLDRVMHVALLGYSLFIAITILWLNQKNHGRILTTIFIIFIFIEAIQSPILYGSNQNMSRDDFIVNYSRIFSFYKVSDFEYIKWIQNYTSVSSVFLSDIRGSRLSLLAKRYNISLRTSKNMLHSLKLYENQKVQYFSTITYIPGYLSVDETIDKPESNLYSLNNLLNISYLNIIYSDSRIIGFYIK